MKYFYTLIIFLLMTTMYAQETTTIYLIRHAEKADTSRDTELSVEGKVRAKKWESYFSDKNITAIYATPYKRTNATVAPLAERLKLKVVNYDIMQMDLSEIIEKHEGKAVLIVGHSNTLPNHINKLLNDNVYKEIDESEFGTLYTIIIKGDNVAHKIEIL